MTAKKEVRQSSIKSQKVHIGTSKQAQDLHPRDHYSFHCETKAQFQTNPYTLPLWIKSDPVGRHTRSCGGSLNQKGEAINIQQTFGCPRLL